MPVKMYKSIIRLVKALVLASILCEVLFASASGFRSQLHRGRSSLRATRHNLRGISSHHKRQGQTACPPDDDDDYGAESDGDDYSNSERYKKRELSGNNFKATRYNPRGLGSRTRRPRQEACPPDDDYYAGDSDSGADTDDYGDSDTEDKGDYAPSDSSSVNNTTYPPSDGSSLANTTYAPDNSSSLANTTYAPSNSSPSDSTNYTDSSSDYYSSVNSTVPLVNATLGNITLASSSFDNVSQPFNGSQYNTSFLESDQALNNLSSLGTNQSEALNNISSIGMNQSEALNTTLGILANQTQGINLTAVDSFASTLLSELPENGMKKNNLFLGFLPDDGSSGGDRQTIAQLNSAIGSKASVYGWYAQAHSGVPFDGSQLLSVRDDVKACNCVFQPAIMPVDGWKGLTSDDNSQAVAIAQVLKNFTDEGIPVWLRFAHEANYYQTDGTYQGTAADFKAGWATVADAIDKIAPSVKMWWTPNVSTPEDYTKYEPDDMSTVDLVGIDFYPKQLSGTDFLDAMKDFHDKYAVDGRKFAIGETGLGWSGSVDDKVKWFNEICEAKASMPNFISSAWFNFKKEYDYQIAGQPTLDQKFTSLIAG
ncbi:hypothetical protein Pst134EB_025077 [Puccinia striiformis f. sp. tritici]|nr:hypothetical protein Pst134EB_025077 [Puccinia striiformis f. sp. tritici]